MKLNYKLNIKGPHTHILQVLIRGTKPKNIKYLDFFLPSWSPGSYLMREYARNIKKFEAFNKNGDVLFYQQIDKGTWRVSWDDEETPDNSFNISYEIYCHELTVRTSHIDDSHAFIHGPSVLMSIVDIDIEKPVIEIDFPSHWAKVSTGLKDISKKRDQFVYTAENYDELIDAPIEIGNHETDGFLHGEKEHFLAFYGIPLPHSRDLKSDIKKLVMLISDTLGEMPYDKYTFITHFISGKYGGLEHLNSTALQFDAFSLQDRKKYINWLSLVSHEYFHTWNVKRIRPKELGPFDYQTEANTTLLWLAEGLTSFMDELFVFRSDLIDLNEYLDLQKKNLERYFNTPGRRFHSLEQSSFNAWNKLYRPDENSLNSSISYYLKGGIAFFVLNILLKNEGRGINDFIQELWQDYKKDPSIGVEKEFIFQLVEKLGGVEVREKFETIIQTTEEIDIEFYFKEMGLELEFEDKDEVWFGIHPDWHGDNLIIKSVILDGPAYKAGLNAKDEILAINNLRLTKSFFDNFGVNCIAQKRYDFTISRLGQLSTIPVVLEKSPRKIKGIKVIDEKKAFYYLR